MPKFKTAIACALCFFAGAAAMADAKNEAAVEAYKAAMQQMHEQ